MGESVGIAVAVCVAVGMGVSVADCVDVNVGVIVGDWTTGAQAVIVAYMIVSSKRFILGLWGSLCIENDQWWFR